MFSLSQSLVVCSSVSVQRLRGLLHHGLRAPDGGLCLPRAGRLQQGGGQLPACAQDGAEHAGQRASAAGMSWRTLDSLARATSELISYHVSVIPGLCRSLWGFRPSVGLGARRAARGPRLRSVSLAAAGRSQHTPPPCSAATDGCLAKEAGRAGGCPRLLHREYLLCVQSREMLNGGLMNNVP